MRNAFPNPLPIGENDESNFELEAAAFLEALEVSVMPEGDDQAMDAPSLAATYPTGFETYDLEELAGLVNPNRWRRGLKKRER